MQHFYLCTQSGYTGTAYLQTSLDVDQLYQTNQITSSPRAEYFINFTTPNTYTLWLRGYANNAAGDSAYLKLGNTGQVATVTGFAPRTWSWASLTLSGVSATQPLTKTGLYTLSLWMREDGLQIDRLLLTTNTTYIPTDFGPSESSRIATQTTLSTTITRTIVYTYDDLYRLTNANYSTGELFAYTYDPAGNRKTQTTLAGTNVYTYDAANRLTQVDGQTYTWDNNGNLLNDGSRTFTYDSADRLTAVTQGATTTQFAYNGDGDRLAQIVAGVTTRYALDPTGLAQVLIETTSGQSTHYLPGLAEYDAAWAYYLPDRLGNVCQLTNNTGQVALSQSFDPFGNVLEQTGSGQSIFGYTGEQIDPTGLVFLRARYYSPGTGRFLTADSVVPDPLRSGGWNRYAYVGNNSVNRIDPSGHCYGPAGGMRNWYGYDVLCNNVDMASIIAGNPNVNWGDRVFAAGYAGVVGGSHLLLAEGVAIGGYAALEPLIYGGVTSCLLNPICARLLGVKPDKASEALDSAAQCLPGDFFFSDPAYEAGQGFSGAYDPVTDQILLAPSTEGATDFGWVEQFGGHRPLGELFAQEPGVEYENLYGYSVRYEGSGELRIISWNSGQLNATNHGALAVPEDIQSLIIDALERTTGYNVNPNPVPRQ